MLNLKAYLNSKTFDISPLNNKIIQGEHNCIKAKITMDRFFGEIDLSKMDFYIHAITNPNSVSLPNQKLEANYSDNFIELIWVISKDFTCTAGEITAIIDGISIDGEQVIKLFSAPLNIIKDPACKGFSPSLGAFQTLLEEVTPLKKSCLESADSAKSNALIANTYYNKTTAIVAKTPYISEDGFWMVWNHNINSFEKTAVKANGERGPQGLKGDKGEQGDKGSNGKSAYQYATSSGYLKSETEFTTDLSNISNKADISLFDVVQPKTYTGNHLTIKHGLPLVIDSLVIQGKTTEKGMGEKSPDNPFIIEGLNNPELTLCGKNLSYIKIGTFSEIDGSETINNSRLRSGFIDKNFNFTFNTLLYSIFNPYYYNKNKKYLGRCNSNEATYIRLLFKRIDSATVTEEDCFRINFMAQNKPSLSTYEPYGGTDYTSMCELNSLTDKIYDEVDMVSGKIIKNIGKIVLNGSESWYSLNNSGNYGRIFTRTDILNSKQYFEVISSHFKTTTGNWATKLETENIDQYKNECCGFMNSIRFVSDLTVDEFKQWLSQNPVTVLYELERPEIIDLTPNDIYSLNSETNILSSSDYTITYKQDVCKFLKSIL